MKLTNHKGLRASGMMWLLLIELFLMGLGSVAHSQAFSTTTVQGTVYLANGQPGTGTLMVSWPSFTMASGQVVVADSMTVAIAPDGFVSVNLAANQGATPAGLYYTAIFYLSDGSVNTQYWVVPVATSATLGQVQARLMPATQAVQAVSKTYVDQSIATLTGSTLTASGGTLSGPLTLCCDPATPLQAANKRYVDAASAQAVPQTGGTLTGPLTATKLGAVYQVDQFAGADFGAKLGACLSGLNSTNGGTCDARNFSGTLAMGSSLVISTANATVLLPCATISTANQVMVTAGTRNVTLRGCALRGASTTSGSQGGTVFYYSGTGAMVQVGDPTYAADTLGFHLDNTVVNITAATSASAQGFAAYRTQELDLESLYFLGNQNQTGMTLDGTGNYTGGMFYDNEFTGFQTAVNAIGHQITNGATTDWVNASTFVRLHIDCPTSGGSPVSGTFGINLQQGDGNTFTGGDVEGCSTAMHLGANAQNNTIVGLRNENSTNQVVADAGSSYNDWMTGGTMFAGQLTDNGTRNSFLDTFHRSFNGLNGDWYGSQKDATVTNHYRLGTGAGNERGLLNRYQSDSGYRWTMGLSDATAGEQFYQVLDELNNVYRVSVGQYNNGQSSTNNQTVINAAGTGAVVLNGSNNAGTGGVVIGSGGASETTVATINNAGNAQFNGSLQVGGSSTFSGTATVRNQADTEIDATLWAGLTASQKESFIYKDWNGNSQWYMVKDGSNNWAVNSATGGLDSFKAYQNTNSGDTYINTSNNTGVVRINYETGSGTQFKVYGGNSSTLYASFTGTTSIQFPGIAASSGHNCLQVDNSGYVTNTGSACGAGGGNGTVNTGSSGQIAYYNGAGTALSGLSAVSVTAGGTGASTATGGLANLGGAALTGAVFTGPVTAPQLGPFYVADAYPGADCGAKINAAITASGGIGTIQVGAGCGNTISTTVNPIGLVPGFAPNSAPVSIEFVSLPLGEDGVWWLSAPIINGVGGSISGLPQAESSSLTYLMALPNYTGMCPADSAGTTYSALICMQLASSLSNISIDGNNANQPSSVITSYATGSGVVTLQGANTFTAGQPIYFNIASGPTFLNPELHRYTVLSAGLSTSQFEVAYSGATGSGSATGTAAAAIHDVLLQNGGQVTISYASILYASQDGIHNTSTFYPTVAASQTLALNTIVYLYSSTGMPQLYKVTVAGTGTSSYPGYPSSACTPVLGATCTWGGVTFTNIGASYDNASSNGFVGPNVVFYGNGRDGFFTERNRDWTASDKVQFEVNGRDGFHCEDCQVYRFGVDDWGGNGRYGFYAAVVNGQCASGLITSGHLISPSSQFAGNVSGDIVVDGSAASAIGFCATPSAYQIAGNLVIIGNQFGGPSGSANLTNAIQLINAGGNIIVGNIFGNGESATRYNYLVTSEWSALTGSARVPNQISKTEISPSYSGPPYQAATPYLLTTGVDKADAVISPGTETEWGNRIINGDLTATTTNSTTTNSTTTNSTATNSTPYTTTKSFALTFANGTSNQKIDLYFPPGAYVIGEVIVSLTDTDAFAYNTGSIKKFIGAETDNAGTTLQQVTRYQEASGGIASAYAINDLAWDSGNSRWKITIACITPAACDSSLVANIAGFSDNTAFLPYMTGIQASAVYTTDSTVYPSPAVTYSGSVLATGGFMVGTLANPITIIPSTAAGYHGTGSGDVKVQMSDGTGNANAPAFYNSTGGFTGASPASPSTAGYLHWTGSAWEYANPAAYSLPSTVVQTNQANTYTTGLQNFSSATMKLPSSVTVGANSITLPASSGTVALTSQLPSVGSWGALNYPTWVSGTPFVKMTAAGTFVLDTNTYANPTFGSATLSSGTKTVSNAAACTPSATCVYKLTNCGLNSSTAIGTLSIGTVSAGTSFVINSESSAAAVVTGDKSVVCWQIN